MMKPIYLYGIICLLITLLIGCMICYGSDMATAEARNAELQQLIDRNLAANQQLMKDRDAEWQRLMDDREAEYVEFLETEYQPAIIEAIEERDAEWEQILQQAIADRDAEWEQAIRQSNDEEVLDLIMEILPYILI